MHKLTGFRPKKKFIITFFRMELFMMKKVSRMEMKDLTTILIDIKKNVLLIIKFKVVKFVHLTKISNHL